MNLKRIIHHEPLGHWPRARACDSITLTFDDRFRRRIRLRSDGGCDLLLDLPRAIPMGDGDGLRTDAGGWLTVIAAAEPLVEVRCADLHHLLRIAWHLGNRHLPAEIAEDRILIRPDHVIEEMLRGLGAETRSVHVPFQPEGGAYEGHGHHHHHGPAEASHEAGHEAGHGGDHGGDHGGAEGIHHHHPRHH